MWTTSEAVVTGWSKINFFLLYSASKNNSYASLKTVMLLRIENKTCDGSVVLYRKINKFLPNFYCTKLRQKFIPFFGNI